MITLTHLKSALFVVTLLLTSTQLHALEETREFGFGSREIFQFDKKISHLNITDINQDGLDDAVFLNNSLSKIEILIRKKTNETSYELPALKDVFTNQGFLMDKQSQILEIGDFNNDSLPDFLLSGHGSGLTIIYQDKTGAFLKQFSPYLDHPSDTIEVNLADFNKDGALDILVCRKQNAEILFNDSSNSFRTRQMIEFSSQDCQGSLVGDFNTDGYIDLFFYFPGRINPLSLYTGQKSGYYGWEKPVDFPEIKYADHSYFSGNSSDLILAILNNSKNLKLYELSEKRLKNLFQDSDMTSSRIHISGSDNKNSLTHIVSDLNNDGYQDICVTSPALSQIRVFKGSKTGLSSRPQIIDSLSHIQNMGLNSKKDLFVFSKSEQAVAMHSKTNRDSFPEFIQTEDKTLLMAISPHFEDLYILSEMNKSKIIQFQVVSPYGNHETISTHFPSENIPDSMIIFPLEKSLMAVLCFMPYDTPLMFKFNGKDLTSVSQKEFRALRNELTPSDISIFSDSDQIKLLVCEGSTARLYHYKDSVFSVIQQYNTGETNALLKHGTPYQGPDEKPGYLIFNEGSSHLFWFPENKKRKKIRLDFSEPFLNLTSIVPFNQKKQRGLIFTGKSDLKWISEKSLNYDLNVLSEYTSKSTDAHLWNLFPVQIGKSGKQMAAALDAQNSSVEIMSADNGILKNEVVFAIFQNAGSGFNKPAITYEPREITSGDLNGDGIKDLGVIVHDKIIFYTGE